MTKKKTGILCALLTVLMLLSGVFSLTAFASEGTEGDELEVMQPQKLEIQLGTAWSGVEFELRTDAGKYPGVVRVGADGVLRMEIGGSDEYLLSCINSKVEVPDPEQALATKDEVEIPAEEVPTAEPTPQPDPNTVAGIPVAHLLVFVGGLLLAVVVLVVLRLTQGKRAYDEEDDEE